MSDQFKALALRAKQLNGEAQDIEPTPRALMFMCAAMLAMSQDEVFDEEGFDKHTEQGLGGVVASMLGGEAPDFVRRAARVQAVASILEEKIYDTGFHLCNVKEAFQ